jgi:hypothetical protein
MELRSNIMNFPIWLLLVFGLVIIYLIIRRIDAKKKENFEDRDN